MKLNFKGEYNKEEIKYISKAIKEITFDEDDEYLYVGEVTFVATKRGDIIDIDKITNVI